MAATANHRIYDQVLDPVGRCLTPDVEALDVIAILQAKARKTLNVAGRAK